MNSNEKEMHGTLIIKPLRGILLRDTDIFGKMDPYLVMNYEGHNFKTDICKRSGKFPIWQNEFRFRFYKSAFLIMKCYDKDYIGSDDIVGEGSYSICNISKGRTLHRVRLSYDEKLAGDIFLEIEFTPDSNIGEWEFPNSIKEDKLRSAL